MEKIRQRKYFILLIFSAFALLFVSITLLDFYKRIQEREYNLQLNALEELSIQENAIVENKLEGYLTTLQSVAGFLGNGELHTEDNLNLLYDMAQETDFQRIGLADLEGNSRVSNGKTLNISYREYFQRCMEKESVITESRDSYIMNSAIFIVSVPVLDRDNEVKGVLYGVIETDRFHLYEETKTEKESKYIHIIDRNGNFILRENVAHSLIETNNFFDGLKKLETQIPSKEIIKNVKQGQSMVTEVSDGQEEKIAYFYPLKINNWYIVTVLNKADITESVDYLLENDVFILTINVMGAMVVLCVLILHYSSREKKK